MNVSCYLVLLTVLCGFGKLISTDDIEDPDQLSRAKPSDVIRRPTIIPTEEKDLSYPGCGLRIPKIGESGKPNSSMRNRGKRPKYQRFPFSTRGKREIMPNIIGGFTAAENSWPWMVALFKKDGLNSASYRCGASLISEKYILSAAHCFNREDANIVPSEFQVLVGAHMVSKGTWYQIKKILRHPDFKKGMMYNDIAILELRNPIKLSKTIYPVCLPPDRLRDKIEEENYYVTATGWGDTSEGGKMSTTLQEVPMIIISLKECNSSYSKIKSQEWFKGITKVFICAGDLKGGKDACQGDSGGPLVTTLDGEHYFQLGVVSFGLGCGKAEYPGVYTRVSQFTKWIFDNTDLKKV